MERWRAGQRERLLELNRWGQLISTCDTGQVVNTFKLFPVTISGSGKFFNIKVVYIMVILYILKTPAVHCPVKDNVRKWGNLTAQLALAEISIFAQGCLLHNCVNQQGFSNASTNWGTLLWCLEDILMTYVDCSCS